jgi:hypothetical protein
VATGTVKWFNGKSSDWLRTPIYQTRRFTPAHRPSHLGPRCVIETPETAGGSTAVRHLQKAPLSGVGESGP